VGTVSRLPANRSDRSTERRAPRATVRVTLDIGDAVVDAVLGVLSFTARVTGGRAPFRLYLYVDGDLADTWTEPERTFDFSLDEHGPGRHAVTVRAVDALGRWSGASTIVECVGLDGAGAEGQPAPSARG
jgi:hypothetical protein